MDKQLGEGIKQLSVKEMETEFREEIKIMSASGGDMCLHMDYLFDLVLSIVPKLIVELGIRGGMSTYALQRGARLVKANMIAVDRDDCRGVCDHAFFVQSDDIEFAAQFPAFCGERGIVPEIDLLMIDTEHTLEQTNVEVEVWLPYLAPRGRIVFHDTNAQPFYFGVAEFLREWLKIPFPEDEAFMRTANGWFVHHNPDCFGLTTIWRRDNG